MKLTAKKYLALLLFHVAVISAWSEDARKVGTRDGLIIRNEHALSNDADVCFPSENDARLSLKSER